MNINHNKVEMFSIKKFHKLMLYSLALAKEPA